MVKKAVIMKGDGIGPEVVDSMINILKECNLQSELIYCDAGSEQWEQNGCKDPTYIPESTMKNLEEADACFKGPTFYKLLSRHLYLPILPFPHILSSRW